ncbi:hypothetical protein FF36_05477 [Frankia torreyi]|uniref:Uncharacterized protein n=1 Tax=Frankia torreyi TaxID=1856 RepID=A0A0D8B7Y3_9ACTN|nr:MULTISPECIES: hypothetical protein [Frankia]KJE20200.1 hypothetical protein FF36_05477 [Frankia torreyi]
MVERRLVGVQTLVAKEVGVAVRRVHARGVTGGPDQLGEAPTEFDRVGLQLVAQPQMQLRKRLTDLLRLDVLDLSGILRWSPFFGQ